MNSAGIDVSKGKSMVAVFRPFNKTVSKPFEVRHTGSELRQLADFLKSLEGETRVVIPGKPTNFFHAHFIIRLRQGIGSWMLS